MSKSSDPLSPQACMDTAASLRCDATLPDNPQCALNVHFGMMLGVDELRAEQGFHLGRARRHQRLLHGTGVVAGYAIAFDDETFDLRVTPGLAVDALGRDLALDQDQCVNLVQWWLRHRQDEAFDDLPDLEDATVDLDIVVCYSTCLSQPVPAIAEPCAGNASDIAYARVCETVTLHLVRRVAPPADAPAPTAPPPWPTTRDALARALAALDVAPPEPTDPADLCLPLACLRGVHLRQQGGQWQASVDTVDVTVRPLLLSTAVLQDLQWPGLSQPAATPQAAGPQVVPGGATVLAAQVSLVFDGHLAAASVKPEAFAVSEFDPALGWRLLTVQSAAYADVPPGAPTVALTLDEPVGGTLVRVTVVGDGPTPLLGETFIPAGAPHPASDGRSITTTIHRG